MADLYLSQQEATVLSYVTLAWGFVQWWDLIDKRDMEIPQAAEQTSQVSDPVKALEQVFGLLKSRNDTECFVGLTLLRTMLDNSVHMQKNVPIVIKCWTAIPPKFLDRLLAAHIKASDEDEQAKSMSELAVAIIHAFIVLLPQNQLNVLLPSDMGEKTKAGWTKRIENMITMLPKSSPEIRLQILQVLYSFACTAEGAILLLRSKNWTSIVNFAPRGGLTPDIVKHTYLAIGVSDLSTLPGFKDGISAWLDRDLSILVMECKDHATTELVFGLLNELLDKLPHEFFQTSPTWLAGLTKKMHSNSIRLRSNTTIMELTIMLAASLLRVFPTLSPRLIFDSSPQHGSVHTSKPLSYLFVKLVLVDIRSTIPSLQEILNHPTYGKTSSRLAASYDILSAFTGFLMQSLGDDDDDEPIDKISQKIQSLSLLPPDLLLQLRVDISEVMSFTIEHFRDRYDASLGGAAGLHHLVRSAPPLGTGTPAAIAWDTSEGMAKDPLTLSQLRALALWIRDDEGDELRKEAAGITDVLMHLYSIEDGLDFRYPISIALEGTCATSEGVYSFISENGWDILAKDLRDLVVSRKEYHQGIQLTQVLLAVLDSDETGPTKEDWLSTLDSVTSMDTRDHLNAEFMLALLDLAYELLAKAPLGLRRRYAQEASKVLLKAQSISIGKDGLPSDMNSRFNEIVMALEDVMPTPDD